MNRKGRPKNEHDGRKGPGVFAIAVEHLPAVDSAQKSSGKTERVKPLPPGVLVAPKSPPDPDQSKRDLPGVTVVAADAFPAEEDYWTHQMVVRPWV